MPEGGEGYGRAALDGGLTGALVGALVGLLFGLLNLGDPTATGFTLAFWGAAAGGLVGAAAGLVLRARRRGRA